jgi:hypothetical protein
MSVNGASTIFGVASGKMKMDVQQHKAIIELSTTFLGEMSCANIAFMS